MKKRLSLLMVLMMVLSLVPMSAFAASATMPSGIFKVEDTDTQVSGGTTKAVTAKLTQAQYSKLTSGGEVKLTLNKGEFSTAPVVNFDPENDLAISTTASSLTTNATISGFKNVAYFAIPDLTSGTVLNNASLSKEIDILINFNILLDDVTAGDVTLEVDEVAESGLSVAKPILIGVVNEGTGTGMKATANDATKKISFEGGSLSKFTVKDIDKVGTLDLASPAFIKVELPEYVRFNANTTVSVGSVPATTVAATSPSALGQYTIDKNILTVYVPAANLKQQVMVDPDVSVVRRDASKGDITAKISVHSNAADARSTEKLDLVIGQIADYDVAIKANEKGKKEIPAIYGGDETTVEVKLTGVKGSFTDNRDIDFTVNGADVVSNSIKNEKNLDNLQVTNKGSKVEDGEFTYSVNGTDKDELKFELRLKAKPAQNGAVTITAESRDFTKLEAEIAKVTPAYTVETKVTSVRKGESLATADIVIKEAKAGILGSDQFLVLNLNDRSRETLTFGKDYKVEGTNGMKLEDGIYDVNGGTKRGLDSLALKVKTTSTKEAGTITISGVTVKVDGSTVDGVKAIDTYLVTKNDKAYPAGNTTTPSVTVSDRATAVEYALSKDADLDADYSVNYIEVVKEFFTQAATTVFKIGAKEYTVNGETKTANEAPYVSGKGYTMLPVRAVGEALGLKADWNAATKTATFSSDAKVASVVIGADTMYVNGTPFKLSAKAEIKNGSTFVELRSLANAFGVKLTWDAATKSVTIQG